MQKKISIGATALIVWVAIVLTFVGTSLYRSAEYGKALEEAKSQYSAFDKLLAVDELYRQHYVGTLDDQTLADMVIEGYLAGTGDVYAYYFSEEEYEEHTASSNSSLVGIGVIATYDESAGGLELVVIMPDSPADRAGLLPGDVIVQVADDRIMEIGYVEALSRIKGEEGTDVRITVRRGGTETEHTLTREKVTELSVMYHAYEKDPTVGIVRITSFAAKTPEQFFEAVDALRAGGAQRLVVDLRNNTGGNLTAICNILDYLLPDGPIVHLTDKDGNVLQTISSSASSLDMPMAVLTNGSTASAAELFASAMKDYKRATIVGTVTYGKGTALQEFKLNDGSAVMISTMLYNPPFSENFEGKGVEPDHVVELDEALRDKNMYKITDEEDNQLQAAIAILNGNQ